MKVSELTSSPFGGIPRNWKLQQIKAVIAAKAKVPPSGGSLEIGNMYKTLYNWNYTTTFVPPSGGSLEIGNWEAQKPVEPGPLQFPLRGDP